MTDFKNFYISSKQAPNKKLIQETLCMMNSKPTKKQLRFRKPILIAAAFVILLAAATITVSSSYFSEHFGYFGHFNTDTSIVKNVNETADSNLEAEEFLLMTLSKYVMDEKQIYMLIDITRTDGKPIKVNNETTYCSGYNFENVSLICEDNEYELLAYPVEGKGDIYSMQLECFTSPNEVDCNYLSGKNLKIIIDGCKDNTINIERLNTSFNTLYDLYKSGTPLSFNAYTDTGVPFYPEEGVTYNNQEPPYASGLMTPEKGDLKIPLSADFPGAYIDSFGFGPKPDGAFGLIENMKQFYISIVPGNDENAEQLKNIAFRYKNGNIDENIFLSDSQGKGITTEGIEFIDGRIILALDSKYMDISEIDETDLKNFSLIKNYSYSNKEISGKWEITFTPEISSTAVTFYPNAVIETYNTILHVDTIIINATSSVISGTCENMGKIPREITYVMKDDSEVSAGMKIGGGYNSNNGTFSIKPLNATVINPNDVKAIKINDELIELN